MSGYAEVYVDITAAQVDKPFTYAVPDDISLSIGRRVLVPFGPKRLEGYVVALTDAARLDAAAIKPVLAALDEDNAILPELVELARWMAKRYHCSLVDCLRQMIPAQLRGGRVSARTVEVASLAVEGEALAEAERANARAPKRLEVLRLLKDGPKPVAFLNGISAGAAKVLAARGTVAISREESLRAPYQALDGAAANDPALKPSQREAVEALVGALKTGGGRFLLHGVTGSGKTEVYIRLIRACLKRGQAAIVLVPEIALTPQMVGWFRARFGAEAAVLHSRLSVGERYDEWRRIRRGEARVVIGARSAVFAPAEDVGAIIVDEEHESSYRSERRPRYDAREVAQWRMEKRGGVLVLGSATPSLATYMKSMPGVRPENRLSLLEMPERVNGGPLPEVEVVDMRIELVNGNRSMFSGALVDALKDCLDNGRQAILFINRRGYSTFVSCRACGYVERCHSCDVSMTYHMADAKLRCHYCGAEREPPKVCPECGSRYIRYFGAGTQKVEEEFQKLFPGVATLRMDMDTTGGKDAHEKLLSAFRRGEARVLVGTQMVAKGLDFPNVTLVGVVSADMTLHVSDYRSVERTFQLITQVAGRAGRAEYPGRVIVQTYDPEHYGIQLAAKQDFRAFYVQEERARRRGLYPPFTVLARLLASSKDSRAAADAGMALESRLRAALEAEPELMRDVVQVHADEAPIKLLRGEYRWQVFVKMYSRPTSDAIIAHMEELEQTEFTGVRVELEVNPATML